MANSERAIPEEDIGLRQAALAYVIELYRELTEENGAPTLGTQNQAVDFILADPERRRRGAEGAASASIEEATAAPPRRVPPGTPYIEGPTRREGVIGPP